MQELTDEQRAKGTARSVEMRKRRAKYKHDFREGRITLREILEADDEVARGMRVESVLRCINGVGKATAESGMKLLGICPNRKVGGLGAKQREKLIRYTEAFVAANNRRNGMVEDVR